MAEKKEMHQENIKIISEIFSSGKLSTLNENVTTSEKSVKKLKSALEEKLNSVLAKAKGKIEEVKEDVSTVESKNVRGEVLSVKEEPKKETVKEANVKQVKEELAQDKKEVAVEDKSSKTDKQEKESVQPKLNEKEQKKVDVKVDKDEKLDKKTEVKQVKEEVKSATNNNDVRPVSVTEKNQGVSTNSNATANANANTGTAKPLPSFIVRRNEFVPEKPKERPQRNEFKPRQDRGEGFNNRPPRSGFNQKGERNFTPNGERQNSGFRKTQGGAGYVAPAIIPQNNDKRSFNGKKKNNGEKNFEEKSTLNKRALIRNNVDIDDFDENKTGYRKFRPAKKNKEQQEVKAIKIERAVINTEIIPLKVLSEKIGITAAEITKRLFKEGIMKTINDSVDFDTAAFIAADIGVELELKLDKTAEDVLSEGFEQESVDPSKLITRSPVVTVMGHVDHGKTSILDRIRKSNVTAGEAGGITQHIGAYQVSFGKSTITFLDTPGHAAFTAMRARGAEATDIAVLVVAADDGIMPQTIEAINHAKAANVPIIVAINKIDKPEKNLERIKTQLTENGLLPEEWGGDTILCPVSAKTGEGFDNLLNSINLVAEMAELKADPTRKAKGVVIEAKLDQSKGPVATILVQNGTLKVADSVIVGMVTGKIRAMVDDKGRRVNSAGPSTPVSVMGLDEVPNAGDILYAVEQEKLVKLVAEERKNRERENMVKNAGKVTLDDVFSKIAEGDLKGLNIIVKADVQGSVEAVKQSLEKLSNEEVKVNVIHAAAGAIKESDIMLAESSNAIIIGFNVRPDSNAKTIAERSGVDIKLYRVIYEAIEDVQKALKGMLAPKFKEVYLGKAEVREVFKISGVGQVAGCYVTEGKILRSGKLRIYRDDVMICEGNVLQLKRFKDDVKEVAQGFECGISIEKFNDIKVGDFIESYQVEEDKE